MSLSKASLEFLSRSEIKRILFELTNTCLYSSSRFLSSPLFFFKAHYSHNCKAGSDRSVKKNEDDGEERINTCFPGKEIRVTEESSSPCAHPHPLILGASTRWAAQKNHGRAPCFFSFFFLSPSCSNSVGSDLLPKSLFSLKRRDKRAPRGP